jgi:hypothetical protein
VDQTVWQQHLEDKLHQQGTLFLVRLAHFEGEFALGLGRRTFAKTDTAKTVEMEWFERKNKRRPSWGQQPAFKLTRVYQGRRVVPEKSEEEVESFLPIVVEARMNNPNEPHLTKACLQAIRKLKPRPLPPLPGKEEDGKKAGSKGGKSQGDDSSPEDEDDSEEYDSPEDDSEEDDSPEDDSEEDESPQKRKRRS